MAKPLSLGMINPARKPPDEKQMALRITRRKTINN
jgi:hypothetical protein